MPYTDPLNRNPLVIVLTCRPGSRRWRWTRRRCSIWACRPTPSSRASWCASCSRGTSSPCESSWPPVRWASSCPCVLRCRLLAAAVVVAVAVADAAGNVDDEGCVDEARFWTLTPATLTYPYICTKFMWFVSVSVSAVYVCSKCVIVFVCVCGFFS